MRTIKRKRIDNSNDTEVGCSSADESKQPSNQQSPDNSNVVSSDSSPTTTNEADNFKAPLSNDIIRRKSNRILTLKRLNQQANQVSSTSINDQNELQQQTLINECDTIASNIQQTSIDTLKPNQASDISSTALNNVTSVAKSLRKIQSWTEDDIRWFFEALCEHGKDFPHIQSYIASRCEKKGISAEMIKNYEQVRHFYYRMWHKISQIVKISSDVEKGVQELYGLINYGEIWKRFGSKFDYRLTVHLQQLVDYGYTVIKIKGKNVRIRTPICNALKKIHNIDCKIQKPITQASMPKEICIELIPATNADWIHVHSIAQNPRLRTKLGMQQRLSTLINYLEKRWNPKSGDCNNYCRLRLRPQQSARLCNVTLKSTSNSISYHSYRSTTHGQLDLSLSSYVKNVFNDSNGLAKKSNKLSRKSAVTASKKASISTNVSQIENEPASKEFDNNDNNKDDDNENEPQPVDLFKLLDSMNEELETTIQPITICEKKDQCSYSEWKNDLEQQQSPTANSINEINDEDDVRLPEPPANQTLAQWLAGGAAEIDEDEDENIETNDADKPPMNNNPDNESMKDSSDPLKATKAKRSQQSSNEVVEMLTVEQARTGWTNNEARAITIGEIYMLFCQPEKIVLEYCWIETNNEENNYDNTVIQPPKSLNTIQKFIIAANMTLMNFKKLTTTANNSNPSNASNSRKRQVNKNLSTTVMASAETTSSTSIKNQKTSELLANLIQETILNDPVQSPATTAIGDENKSIKQHDSNDTKIKSNNQKSNIVNGEKLKTTKNHRSTAVLVNDTEKIDEVLKELKIRGRRTIGRPVNKLIYNHHHAAKQLLNINAVGMTQAPNSTVLHNVNTKHPSDVMMRKKIIVLSANDDVKSDNTSPSIFVPNKMQTVNNSKCDIQSIQNVQSTENSKSMNDQSLDHDKIPILFTNNDYDCGHNSASTIEANNDIETHMNTFAGDNSVELMAKFADLAEEIASNDVKSIH